MKKIIACCFIIFLSNKISSAQGKDSIPCREVEVKCAQGIGGNYVIERDKDYQGLLDIRSRQPDCGNYVLPKIDFNQYTLVGFATSASGCDPPESKHYVTKNKVTGNYQFVYKIIEHGLCDHLYHVQKFCLIPKINPKSKVEFVGQGETR